MSFSTLASKHPTLCDSERHSRHSDLAELKFSPTLEHRLLLLSPLLWEGCLKNGQHTTARKDLSNLAVHRVGDDVHSLTVGSNSAERQGNASPQNDLSY